MSNKIFTQVSIIETLIEETTNGELRWKQKSSKKVRFPTFRNNGKMENLYREVYFSGGYGYSFGDNGFYLYSDLIFSDDGYYDNRSLLKIVMPNQIDDGIRVVCTATIKLDEDQARRLNTAMRKNAMVFEGRPTPPSEKIKEIVDFLLL